MRGGLTESPPANAAGNAPLLDISGVSAALAAFAAERDWDRFHSPKNLVMALTGEASRTVATTPATATAVRDELADVTLYLVRLASVLGVDLNAAVTDKLRKNAEKYPVPKAHGNHKKYDQL